MSYTFDIINILPVLNFFDHQQTVEQTPHRSLAYLGSYDCTLDGFIQSTELVYQKPDWDWDAVVSAMIEFWLNQEERVRHWKQVFHQSDEGHLIVARVANVNCLRREFEAML